MPSINVGEADFDAVANAARDAWDRGRKAEAQILDKMARKINAVLSNANLPTPFGRQSEPLKWKDVPTTLPEEWVK